jgi:hypothetical protein
MPSRISETHEPTRPWVANVLTSNTLYGDKGPSWHNATTSLQARSERERLCRFLFKHSFVKPQLRLMAQLIADCRPNNRCLRGSCPECGRAFQRYSVSECESLLRGRHAMVASVIDSRISARNDLSELSTASLINRTKRCLKKNGVDLAVGGVDFSFNEDQRGQFRSHWSSHLWLILPSRNQDRWEPALRAQNPPSEATPTPVMVLDWDQRNNALAYSLKTTFYRRISVYEQKQSRAKPTRNTNYQDLRVAEKIPLYCYLDAIGLQSRLFLLGARPTATDRGIRLVELRKSVKSRLNAQPSDLSSQTISMRRKQ